MITPHAVVPIHGFIAGEPGWEEVADFALGSATENARTGA
jgi:hypothetical protein